ncbi:hypothetical protein [Cohnella terricola]|uniref:Uncharacterized protein n=1 Tax=Cohnella terricola TaxID=1289167 RepID=A0A559JQE5_9BACL|nr:hypothetical protein [Cohnella terricola]TVY02090.1 hypothetical protein FPZ45_06510 [Cohnella terricola]
MNAVQLGPFLLNFDLLMFILSAFAAFLAIRIRVLRLDIEGTVAEKYSRAMVLGFLTWKLSLMIWDPVSVIQQPMSLLYFDGGDSGIALALLVSLLYVWMRTRKDRTSVAMNLDLASAGWIAGSGIYHLLHLTMDTSNMLFHVLHIIFNSVLAICLYANHKASIEMHKLGQFWMWYSLGMASIYFVMKDKTLFIIGFTKEQVIYIVIFIVALRLSKKLDHKKSKEVY